MVGGNVEGEGFLLEAETYIQKIVPSVIVSMPGLSLRNIWQLKASKGHGACSNKTLPDIIQSSPCKYHATIMFCNDGEMFSPVSAKSYAEDCISKLKKHTHH